MIRLVEYHSSPTLALLTQAHTTSYMRTCGSMRALQHLSYAYILTPQSFKVEGLFDSANRWG